jgi:hypothetical protein
VKIREADWEFMTEVVQVDAPKGKPFNVSAILTCWNPSCKHKYPLWGYHIANDGKVSPNPNCPKCSTKYVDVILEGWTTKNIYDYHGFIPEDRELP